jgi:hypothetical protein
LLKYRMSRYKSELKVLRSYFCMIAIHVRDAAFVRWEDVDVFSSYRYWNSRMYLIPLSILIVALHAEKVPVKAFFVRNLVPCLALS